MKSGKILHFKYKKLLVPFIFLLPLNICLAIEGPAYLPYIGDSSGRHVDRHTHKAKIGDNTTTQPFYIVKDKIDFNGDRKADLVFKGPNNTFWVSCYPDFPYVQHNPSIGNVDSGFGDFNGDGKTDLIVVYRNPVHPEQSTNEYWVTTEPGNTFLLRNDPDGVYQEYGLGDFDGDGKTDLITLNDKREFWVTSLNGIGNPYTYLFKQYNGPSFTTPSSWGYSTIHGWGVADLDGDKKTDLFVNVVLHYNTTLYINGNKYEFVLAAPYTYETTYGSDLIQSHETRLCGSWVPSSLDYNENTMGTPNWGVADFDGNGTNDLMLLTHESDFLVFSCDRSESFEMGYYYTNFNSPFGNSPQTIEWGLGDFNADQRADLIVKGVDTDGIPTFWVITEPIREDNQLVFLVNSQYQGRSLKEIREKFLTSHTEHIYHKTGLRDSARYPSWGLGNFDGNGTTDLVYIDSANHFNVKVDLLSPPTLWTTNEVSAQEIIWDINDLDGNGISELLLFPSELGNSRDFYHVPYPGALFLKTPSSF